MTWEDPNVQRGLWASLLFALGAIGWWIKRRVGIVDSLEDRMGQVERSKVSHETLDRRIDEVKTEIKNGHEAIMRQMERTHNRVDEIYRIIPKRNGD